MFIFCQFLFSIPAGGGAISQTYTTVAISATSSTVTVADTTDFVNNLPGGIGYIVVDDEVMAYDSKDATHFYIATVDGVLQRGIADPEISSIRNPAASHATNVAVKSLAVQAIDSMLGLNITSSTATFGTLQAFYVGARFFWNFPKFLMWNYPVLNTGQWVMLKFFLFYPLSAGFVFGMIVLTVSLFRT